MGAVWEMWGLPERKFALKARPRAPVTGPPPAAALEVAHQHHRVLLHVEDHRQIRAAGGRRRGSVAWGPLRVARQRRAAWGPTCGSF